MIFLEGEVFDKQLSASMSANTDTITVTMTGEISFNQMPERLDKWLSAVVDKQGRLYFDPTTKSLVLMDWLEKVFGIVILSLTGSMNNGCMGRLRNIMRLFFMSLIPERLTKWCLVERMCL